jgi:S-adenosylmethionine:tRNA ribosyltransferase-isomerase
VHRGVGDRRGCDPCRDLGSSGVGAAVFHAVDDRAAVLLQAVLEPADHRLDAAEPGVDPLPAGRDEVDEEGEVVDAGVPLREQVAFQGRQPPQQLVHQAADLGEVPPDRLSLAANRLLDPAREGVLERGGRGGERLDLLAGPDDEGVECRAVGALLDPSLCAFHRAVVHGPQGYLWRRMKTRELEYDLPPELIAQHPVPRRDEARLLVYDRVSERVDQRRFAELPDVLGEALTVVNDTRVVPARIPIERPRGEVLLLERIDEDGIWEGLARPTRRLREGGRYGPVELLEHVGGGLWRLRLHGEPAGETPLPPYITEPLADPERYQTVYADEAGSAAAPTAGLHFTEDVLRRLDVERVTLHVGLDTFRPIAVDDLGEHTLHGERFSVTSAAWHRIDSAPRVLAVGTTTVRVLETLARGAPLAGRTNLFITPGFEFKRTDALLTNFHLPRSTLLALVMAFTGVEETRRLYRLAIEERYRFYSFGDAMLVL